MKCYSFSNFKIRRIVLAGTFLAVLNCSVMKQIVWSFDVTLKLCGVRNTLF
jgi:hypothetical protein